MIVCLLVIYRKIKTMRNIYVVFEVKTDYFYLKEGSNLHSRVARPESGLITIVPVCLLLLRPPLRHWGVLGSQPDVTPYDL